MLTEMKQCMFVICDGDDVYCVSSLFDFERGFLCSQLDLAVVSLFSSVVSWVAIFTVLHKKFDLF